MDKRFSPAYPLAKFLFGVSIRTKLMAVGLIVVLVSGTFAIVHTRKVVAQVVGKRLDERALSRAENLARRSLEAVVTNDTYALYELLDDMTHSHADVRYAFVVGQNGDILAHTFHEGVPRDLLSLNMDASKGANLIKIQTEEGIIRDAVAPLDSALEAVVKVGVTETFLNQSLASSTRALAAGALIAAAVSLCLSYIITLLILRPVRDLQRAAQAVGEGSFEFRARIWWNDEIGYLARVFNKMAANLEELYASLREKEEARTKLLQKIIAVQEDERKRIARELHDETSQSLASVNLSLSTILDEQDPRQGAENLQAVVRQALERIRNLAYELRPGLLDDLGLVAAIDRYVDGFQDRYGLPADFQSVGVDDRRLRPEIETAVYRIVQEALVNAARHAQANHASVIMKLQDGWLRVLVEDNGCGFDVDKISSEASGRSLGMFGMQERATLVGGILSIDSTPGEGTSISLVIPDAE